MSDLPASWSVITVQAPNLARTAAGPSPVEHSDWVRLFLGQSLARARASGTAGPAASVEYLVSGAGIVGMSGRDDASLREASAALGAGFNGVQRLLEFHRKRVRSIAAGLQGGGPGSVPPLELVLKAYPMLMCVTVSDDPGDWIATDEGLCIVRWGLAGPRHRPLLQWSDADLAAMRRCVFERTGLVDGGGGKSPDEEMARAAVRVVQAGVPAASDATPKESAGQRAGLAGRADGPSRDSAPRAVPSRSAWLDRFNIALFALSVVLFVAAVAIRLRGTPAPAGRMADDVTQGTGGSGSPPLPAAPIERPSTDSSEATGNHQQTLVKKDGELESTKKTLTEANQRFSDLKVKFDEAETQLKGQRELVRQISEDITGKIGEVERLNATVRDQATGLESAKRKLDQIKRLLFATWIRESLQSAQAPSIPEALKLDGGPWPEHYADWVRIATQEIGPADQPAKGLADSLRPFGGTTVNEWMVQPVQLKFEPKHFPRRSGCWFWVTKEPAVSHSKGSPETKQSIRVIGEAETAESESLVPLIDCEVMTRPGAGSGPLARLRSHVSEICPPGKSDLTWREVVGLFGRFRGLLAIKSNPQGASTPDDLHLPKCLALPMLQLLCKEVRKCPVPQGLSGLDGQLKKIENLLGIGKQSTSNWSGEVAAVIDEMNKILSEVPKPARRDFIGVIDFSEEGTPDVISPLRRPIASGSLYLVMGGEGAKPKFIGTRDGEKNSITEKLDPGQDRGFPVICTSDPPQRAVPPKGPGK